MLIVDRFSSMDGPYLVGAQSDRYPMLWCGVDISCINAYRFDAIRD